MLTACSNILPTATPYIPTNTTTPSITPTSTTTVVWFPPTSTPTKMLVQNTPEPTVITGPSDRIFILSDDFSQESAWLLYREEKGGVALGKNELTLAVAESGASINTFKTGAFPDDYYLEITANPSLCRGEDSYGVLLRVVNDYAYYRMGVNCNNQLRFEWVRDGKGVPLQDWISSKIGLMSATGKNIIGIWAVDREIRVYINHVYQFSIYGLAIEDGSFGLFARSGGDTAVTVNFSDLQVFEGGTLPPTPTVEPTVVPSITPTIRTP